MPRLLVASGPPIELDLDRDYILGRGRDCDIVVGDVLCSRHHARLTVGRKADDIYVTDLESRNGTFVDDQRIDQRTPLHHGSRVRVGAAAYILSLAAGGTDDPRVETGTVAFDLLTLGPDLDEGVLRSVRSEGAAASVFAGQLDTFGLIDVLQGLMQSGRSGTLHVALPSCHAHIEVRSGEVFDADCGASEGFDALVALARERVGVFWLAETSTDCARTIDEPQGRLLYALVRALDDE